MRSSASIMPRGLGELAAANYVHLTLEEFRKFVRSGKMPRPRLAGEKRIWDAEELNEAFGNLPHEGENLKDTWADFDGSHKTASR